MTNSEIMRADVLDILFENRNKNYGAYNLRKEYDKRMLIALGAGLAILCLVLSMAFFGGKQSNSVIVDRKGGVEIKEINLPKKEVKQPEKPKELPKPKVQIKSTPQVAQVKHTTPVITPDEKVKEPVKTNEDLTGKQIADNNSVGNKDDGIVKQPEPPKEGGTGTGIANPPVEQKQSEFIIQERNPEFPGGVEAFRKFMAKYLVTPDGLEAGQSKIVKVKFKVDKDGSVNSFEIVTSGGSEYDNEVVRVCKKMPRWVPAIQNGVNVSVNYVIPVTFMGIEE